MRESGFHYRQESRDTQQIVDQTVGQKIYLTPRTLYRPSFTHKSLADYTQQLAMELMSNSHELSMESLIGVASFVELDETLLTSSVLGNQLGELLIGQIQRYGMSVVDFKTTGNVLIDRTGDYAFSRNTEKLAQRTGLDFVLSGTLISTEKGVKVNARIINLGSKVVVSSGSLMIPHFVVEELQPKFVLMQ
jgi:TolB-like protein